MFSIRLQDNSILTLPQTRIETFINALPGDITALAEKGGAAIVNAMYLEAPVRTGDLSHSMRYETITGSSGAIVTFQNEMYYANFVAEGHYSRGGNFVPANDFPGRALERSRTELVALLAQIGATLI